ncbi:MAG: DbpA RNA binding domain-containing protein, partial [Solirubrobacteraceae bacterium]|nr:DbpA RNA binding domain-containing protein [Solirubrobacteraceae bacterium]
RGAKADDAETTDVKSEDGAPAEDGASWDGGGKEAVAAKAEVDAGEKPKRTRSRRKVVDVDPGAGADEEVLEEAGATASTAEDSPKAETNGSAPAKSDAADDSDSDDDRPARARRRRSKKPGLSRGEGPLTSVVAQLGNADGVSVADIVRAITDAAAVDGEAVQDVRVRERFTLLRIPSSELETVLGSDPAIDGRGLALTTLG